MAAKKGKKGSGGTPPDILDKLSKRMRELRLSGGHTNYERFANDHEIGRAQYNRYENGHDIRFSTLDRVIKALGVSYKEFFSEGFDD
jgi:transcriptional regulator with XRE-family HTH domain